MVFSPKLSRCYAPGLIKQGRRDMANFQAVAGRVEQGKILSGAADPVEPQELDSALFEGGDRFLERRHGDNDAAGDGLDPRRIAERDQEVMLIGAKSKFVVIGNLSRRFDVSQLCDGDVKPEEIVA